MNRRHFLLGALAVCVAAPAQADVLNDIMQQLSQQGFTRMQVTQTLLGRTRVVAWSPQFRREIVFNANTGEILRDYWQALASTSGTAAPRIANPSGGSADDRDDDRRDDDDDRDDDRDDDDSGRGRGRGRGRGGDGDDD